MNNQILFVVLLFILTCSCSSNQKKEVVSNSGAFTITSFVESDGPDQPYMYTYRFEPMEKKPLELQWSVVSSTLSKSWDIYFCDNKGCHYEWNDTMKLDPILHQDDEKEKSLSIYIHKNGISGSGTMKILLRNKRSNVPDTLIFDVDSLHLSGKILIPAKSSSPKSSQLHPYQCS